MKGGPHGAQGYNVGAVAAGVAALGLAGAAAYGVGELHKHNSAGNLDSKIGKPGKPAKMGSGAPSYGGQPGHGYGSTEGYPPQTHGYNQPAPYHGASAVPYTPAGYPIAHGGHGDYGHGHGHSHGGSEGKYELHHEGSHKMKKGKKEKKHKKGKK